MIIGIAGGTKDTVVGLGAKAKFGSVGLANENGPRITHALGHQAIIGRGLAGEQRRSHRSRNITSGRQVLDRLRDAMQPAPRMALGQLTITGFGLSQQHVIADPGNDGIDPGIDSVDMPQIGRHHFATGNLPGVNCPGQRRCAPGQYVNIG